MRKAADKKADRMDAEKILWEGRGVARELVRVRPQRLLAIATDMADQLGATKEWQGIAPHLDRLACHHMGSLAHSLRVGLGAAAIAAREAGPGNDESVALAFLAGTAHDVGKAIVPVSVLDMAGPFGPAEREAMHQHAREGYDLLRRTRHSKASFPLVALTAGVHHELQPNHYGIGLELKGLNEPERREMLAGAGLVYLCDFADVVLSRREGSSRVADAHDMDEIRQLLTTYFPEARVNVLIGEAEPALLEGARR